MLKKLFIISFLSVQTCIAKDTKPAYKETKKEYIIKIIQKIKNKFKKTKARLISYTKKTKPLTELNSPYFSLNQQGFLQALFNIDDYTLRTIKSDDFEIFKQLWTDKELMKYYANGSGDETSATNRFNTMIERVQTNNPMAWLTVCKKNKVLGFMGIGISTTQEVGDGQFIFFLAKEAHNQGIGSKLVAFAITIFGPELKRLGLLNFKEFNCFLYAPLTKIFACAHDKNIYSIRILDNAGFKPAYIYGTEKTINEQGKEHAVKYLHDAERYCFEYILP